MESVAKAILTVVDGVEHIYYRGRLLRRVAGGDDTLTVTDPTTLEEWRTHLSEVTARMQAIDEEHRGQYIDPESEPGQEWNHLGERRELAERTIAQLEARLEFIAETREGDGNREAGAEFQVRRPRATRGEDIYDLSTVRMSITNPDEAVRELRDRALRSVESATFPHQLDPEHCRTHIERLIDRHDNPEREDGIAGEIARRILMTGSPAYRRAFKKTVAGQGLSPEEQRALSVGTGSAGGFAVVYTLDPTIIPTSNLSVNPFRRIARVETIAGTNEWRGVTSAGVTAAYAAEAAEASDNSPTLAQPSVVVARAQCFVPVSIELTQDWGSIQTDLAALIQDSKDDLEATQFTTGTYSAGANPGGIITGATTTVAAGGVASFAVADVYATEQALGPRFRPRAQWLGNRFTYNKIRQFDTGGGASLWTPYPAPLREGLNNDVPRGGNMGADLIGYPANEDSAMAAALTTGSKILVLGDFRYFIIVDRVGMDIEVIPHLFGAANRFPTGQRGFYAYWRNSSKVLDANAFRVLVTG